MKHNSALQTLIYPWNQEFIWSSGKYAKFFDRVLSHLLFASSSPQATNKATLGGQHFTVSTEYGRVRVESVDVDGLASLSTCLEGYQVTAKLVQEAGGPTWLDLALMPIEDDKPKKRRWWQF